MVKILKCYLIPKKTYGTLSKGAIFLANPVFFTVSLAFKLQILSLCFIVYKRVNFYVE